MKHLVIDPVSNPNYNGNKLLGILLDCVSLAVSCGQLKSTPTGRFLSRANQLGEHALLYSTMPAPPGNDRPWRRHQLNWDPIDLNEFQRKSDLIDPSEFMNMDIHSSMDSFCNSIYDAARESPVTCNDDDPVLHDNRWGNILNSKDDRLLWRSIDWNGVLINDTLQRPSDNEFKDHLETLLNWYQNKTHQNMCQILMYPFWTILLIP